MTQGFSSIADLQVIVDANVDKLNSNLLLAQNTIHRFAGEGNSSLSGFDAAVAKLGGGVDVVRGKLNVWLEALKLVGTHAQVALAAAGGVADKIGARDDFDRSLAAVTDLQLAIGEGLSAAYGRASAAAGLYATASADASEFAPSKAFSKGAADIVVDTLGQVGHGFRRLGEESKWSSKTIESELSLVEHQLNAFADEQRRIAAEGSFFDYWFGTDRGAANIDQLAALLDRVKELNETRRANQAANTAAERSAAEALGGAEFDKITQSLDKEIEALQRKANVLGMTKGEAASYNAVMQVMDALIKNNALLTEDAAARLGDYSARIRELVDAAEAFGKTEQAEKFVAGLGRELRNLDQTSATLGKSTAEVAALNAEMRIRNQIEDQGLRLSDEQRAKVEETIGALRSRTLAYLDEKKARDDAERADKGFEAALTKLQRETLLLREKARALGDTSQAGQVSARVDREIAELQARNLPLSEQRIATLEAEVTRQVEANRAKADYEKKLADVREAGQAVSRSLEGAFAKWTESGKLNVKEMVASIIEDLAKLTFRRGVIDALFGGGGASGGGGGGLLGSLAGSLFGGGGSAAADGWATTVIPAFAGGGRPPLDRPSLVGELGPELFWPDALGTVVPNGQLFDIVARGPAPVSVAVNTQINAAGAYPESIADIRRALAEQSASLPGRVVAVVRDGRERGIV